METQLKDVRLKAKLKNAQLQREVDVQKQAAAAAAATAVAAAAVQSNPTVPSTTVALPIPQDTLALIAELQSKVDSLQLELEDAKRELASASHPPPSNSESTQTMVTTTSTTATLTTPSTTTHASSEAELMERVASLESALSASREEAVRLAESEREIQQRELELQKRVKELSEAAAAADENPKQQEQQQQQQHDDTELKAEVAVLREQLEGLQKVLENRSEELDVARKAILGYEKKTTEANSRRSFSTDEQVCRWFEMSCFHLILN